jgi:hypothetical protein
MAYTTVPRLRDRDELSTGGPTTAGPRKTAPRLPVKRSIPTAGTQPMVTPISPTRVTQNLGLPTADPRPPSSPLINVKQPTQQQPVVTTTPISGTNPSLRGQQLGFNPTNTGMMQHMTGSESFLR